MRGIHYVGQLPEEGDDDHVLILDGIAEVIDLPVLRPEQERVAAFLGKCIGVPIVLVIAVLWMAVIWGAWAAQVLIAKFTYRRSF
jgi:hypothetical protein